MTPIPDDLLMAFDPGGTSGYALSTRVMNGTRSYRTGTFDMVQPLWDLIKGSRPERVAFETFSTGGRVDAAMLHTIELCGSIRGICHVLGIASYGQTPQSRRPFLEQAQTILRGTGVKYMTHEADALAHLLLLEWRIDKGKL